MEPLLATARAVPLEAFTSKPFTRTKCSWNHWKCGASKVQMIFFPQIAVPHVQLEQRDISVQDNNDFCVVPLTSCEGNPIYSFGFWCRACRCMNFSSIYAASVWKREQNVCWAVRWEGISGPNSVDQGKYPFIRIFHFGMNPLTWRLHSEADGLQLKFLVQSSRGPKEWTCALCYSQKNVLW